MRTTLPKALRGNLPLRRVLRDLCDGLSDGLCGVLRGSAGFARGNDPVHPGELLETHRCA